MAATNLPLTPPPPQNIFGSATLSNAPLASGQIFTVESPEVKAEMAKYTDLSPEAAIGNVVMQQSRAGNVTSAPAKIYTDNIAAQNQLDLTRLTTPALELPTPAVIDATQTPGMIQADRDMNDQINLINGIRAKSEIRNQQVIDDIRTKYLELGEQQKLSNTNRSKALEILGTRSGRQRYAPEIQEGILSAEEKAGMKRVSDLQREELSLVQQAKFAHESADFERLSEIQELKASNRKEQNDLLNQAYERMYKNESISIQKMAAAREEKKSILGDLQLMGNAGQTLTAEQAKVIDTQLGMNSGFTQSYLDFTAKEISAKSSMDLLEVQSKLFSTLSMMKPDQSLTYKGETFYGTKEIDPLKGINRNVVKNDITGEQREVYTRVNPETGIPEIVGSQIIQPGTKIAEGVLDTAEKKALVSALDSMSGLYSSVSGFKNSKSALEEYIKNDDIEGARQFIKTQVRNNSTSTQQDKLDGKADAVTSIDVISRLLDEYTAKKGDTNIFKGLTEKVLQKGGFVKDPELVGIANRIGIAIIDYRKAISGAAFTESEGKAYERIFPSIGKTGELNKALMSSLKESLNQYEGTVIKKSIGDRNYESIFGEKKVSTMPAPLTKSFTSVSDMLSATRDDSGTSPYYSWVEQLKIIKPEASDKEILEDLNDTLGSSFNKDLDMSKNGQIGTLSEKYESGGNPGAIGHDSTGGWSYGAYQMIKAPLKTFLRTNAVFGPLFTGLEIGSKIFNDKWRKVSKESGDEFKSAQRDFISKSHFEPQINKIAKAGYDINNISSTLKDVIWSTAVQHGANTDVILRAIKNVGIDDERALIKEIYNQRWSGGKGFASSNQAVKKSVYNRFFGQGGELNEALSKLG